MSVCHMCSYSQPQTHVIITVRDWLCKSACKSDLNPSKFIEAKNFSKVKSLSPTLKGQNFTTTKMLVSAGDVESYIARPRNALSETDKKTKALWQGFWLKIRYIQLSVPAHVPQSKITSKAIRSDIMSPTFKGE